MLPLQPKRNEYRSSSATGGCHASPPVRDAPLLPQATTAWRSRRRTIRADQHPRAGPAITRPVRPHQRRQRVVRRMTLSSRMMSRISFTSLSIPLDGSAAGESVSQSRQTHSRLLERSAAQAVPHQMAPAARSARYELRWQGGQHTRYLNRDRSIARPHRREM